MYIYVTHISAWYNYNYILVRTSTCGRKHPTHTHTHTHTHTSTHARTHARTHTHTHTHTHTRTYTHARTHARTHAPTHIYIHTMANGILSNIYYQTIKCKNATKKRLTCVKSSNTEGRLHYNNVHDCTQSEGRAASSFVYTSAHAAQRNEAEPDSNE